MAGKIFILVILLSCLVFTSCYPELSVQQYDKLKEDLEKLDVQRQQLQAELLSLQAEYDEIIQKNIEIRTYIEFLEKLVFVNNSFPCH